MEVPVGEYEAVERSVRQKVKKKKGNGQILSGPHVPTYPI